MLIFDLKEILKVQHQMFQFYFKRNDAQELVNVISFPEYMTNYNEKLFLWFLFKQKTQ